MTPARFITDSSLAAFARRLRILGYDVRVLAGEVFGGICRVARMEERIVLTLSVRVPRSCAFVERFVVRRDDMTASLRELVARFEASAPPFSRCTECNTLLAAPGDAGALARAPVPPPAGVQVTGQCPGCGRCYWNGSHVERLREWMRSLDM